MQPAAAAADQIAPAGSSSLATSFTTVDANGLTSRIPSHRSEGVFAGNPSFSLGPVDLHAGGLVRQFRVRHKFDLSDNLEAAAGIAYDFKSDRISPTASLIHWLDKEKKKSRIELSDQKLIVRKGWQLKIKRATVGISAEASLSFQDPASQDSVPGPAAAGAALHSSKPGAATASSSATHRSFLGGLSSFSSMHPDLHLSLDYVKPFKYELIGIGLVLLLNMPLKLSNKEAELSAPWGLRQLKGFGRASLKRAGYLRWKLGAHEASGVLDV